MKKISSPNILTIVFFFLFLFLGQAHKISAYSRYEVNDTSFDKCPYVEDKVVLDFFAFGKSSNYSNNGNACEKGCHPNHIAKMQLNSKEIESFDGVFLANKSDFVILSYVVTIVKANCIHEVSVQDISDLGPVKKILKLAFDNSKKETGSSKIYLEQIKLINPRNEVVMANPLVIELHNE